MFTAVFACVSTSAHTSDKTSQDGIASTSLCGDAYVLALAPERLTALSWQSRDKASLAPSDKRALPQIWDDPEILLSAQSSAQPSHIVFGPGEGRRSRRFLSGETTDILWGKDFDDVKTNYTMLGKSLGETARANSLMQDLDARLAALKQPATPAKVLYLNRSGASAGSDTFVDAVIKAAGGENMITATGWPKPDPEELLSLKPDLIVTSYFEDGYASVNAGPVRHKALVNFLDAYERIEIPGALWLCAGPNLIDAAERVNAKILSLP